MVCKGICILHKAYKPVGSTTSRYAIGQKRCQICEIFIKWEGLSCPCCGYKLRVGPRQYKHKKAKLRIIKQQKKEEEEKQVLASRS